MLNSKADREKMLLSFADPRSLIPDGIMPLFDTWMRDTHITLAEDGYYYCTGTTRAPGTENARRYNDGIELWRSPDLRHWESLGMVWSFDRDGTWHNKWYALNGNYKEVSREEGFRAVYAPEIQQIRGEFYITASISWPRQNPEEESSFTCLLKSTTGKPEGPYIDVCGRPMSRRIDSSLFVDDDGTVYYVWQDGRIARMKNDMSDFAEDPRRVIQQHFTPEPYCEGVFIFKHGGKYHMALAIWTMDEGDHIAYSKGSIPQKVSYDCVVASADNVYGPYSQRYTAITGGGHNSFFTAKDGTLYATMFGNPVNNSFAPFYARPAIIPMMWDRDKVFPRR